MSAPAAPPSVLASLLDIEAYYPGLWDLRDNPRALAYWRELFLTQAEHMVELVGSHRDPASLAQARAARDALAERLSADDRAWLEENWHVHSWTVVRERILTDAMLVDPYAEVKAAQNRLALGRVGRTLAEIRSLPQPVDRLSTALTHLFEGNLFDLGSPVAARRDPSRSPELRYLIDDRAKLLELVACERERSLATILVDNAGADFVLGVLSLATFLSESGFDVVLAANESPSLNDVTASEAVKLLAEIGQLDPPTGRQLKSGRLGVVSTGGGTAGLDFRSVSPELSRAVAASDLLILEGQGRAIETNWNARLAVPTLRVATIKDAEVARALGGAVYDFVCELRPPGEGSPTKNLER